MNPFKNLCFHKWTERFYSSDTKISFDRKCTKCGKYERYFVQKGKFVDWKQEFPDFWELVSSTPNTNKKSKDDFDTVPNEDYNPKHGITLSYDQFLVCQKYGATKFE